MNLQFLFLSDLLSFITRNIGHPANPDNFLETGTRHLYKVKKFIQKFLIA